jgi:hypothetical protein
MIQMGESGLAAFYKKTRQQKKEIEAVLGYAVVSTTNVNIVLLVVARGEGTLYKKLRTGPMFFAKL